MCLVSRRWRPIEDLIKSNSLLQLRYRREIITHSCRWGAVERSFVRCWRSLGFRATGVLPLRAGRFCAPATITAHCRLRGSADGEWRTAVP